MKRYRVRVVDEAERDLIDVYRYVAATDSVEMAEQLLSRLEALCLDLAELPTRGNVPEELGRIGVTDHRELHFGPYRIIYEVIGSDVFVHAIVDGRRDMASLLERRLLR